MFHLTINAQKLNRKTVAYLSWKRIEKFLYSFYSPDLATSDIFLFPRMKKFMKGMRFSDKKWVKKKMTGALEKWYLKIC